MNDTVMDLSVQLSLEVGRAQLNIRRLLQLTAGSVIELDRPAGAPLDVMVNGRLVAHGEVVISGGRYGLRFTQPVTSARTPA
ncbi:MAG: flagellar motor switch protein FliN [Pseudomonadota bacterium]